MWGWCHADFPVVSQQHETSHCIEQYHIILIREMCWKAISSSNKWPTAQQKPEESRLCQQRLCHEKSLILNPLTCHTHSKGPLRKEGAFSGWEQDREEGVTGGRKRDTGGRRGYWGHTSTSQPKEGPVRGRLRQPSLLLAGTMWSSLLPLSSFWGALFHTQTVAVAPTRPAKRCIQTGRGEKRREGDPTGGGYKGIVRRGGQWACPECQFFQATDVMPVPTVGEQRRDQGAPFSFPLHSLFFQDEWIFQKLQPIVSHNRRRLSRFYAAFPVRGGSLSAGIEDRCDAAGTTRSCPSNTLWLRQKGMKGKEEAHSHTHTRIHPQQAHKHITCTHTNKRSSKAWMISKRTEPLHVYLCFHLI